MTRGATVGQDGSFFGLSRATVTPLFDVGVAVFDVRRSLAERRAIGAPSPENIAGAD
jgi:hypothetical protein